MSTESTYVDVDDDVMNRMMHAVVFVTNNK